MSRLYFEALSKIPKRFIHEKTQAAECGEIVVLANPKFAPMNYKKGRWTFVKPWIQGK